MGDLTTYACIGCGRYVDADLEPSPGEPRRCADCHHTHQREFADWLARGWSA